MIFIYNVADLSSISYSKIANPFRRTRNDRLRRTREEGVASPSRREQVFSSAESYSPDQQKHLQSFEKSAESKAIIRKELQQHYLFQSVAELDLERMVACMKPANYHANDIIIKEGDVGECFYVLESGRVSASVEGKGEVCVYGPNGCFGELALVFNAPRAATLIACDDSGTSSLSHKDSNTSKQSSGGLNTSPCVIAWSLDVSSFRYILASSALSETVRRCGFLKKCSFLDPLPVEYFGKLAAALEPVIFIAGSHIIRQGEQGDCFYIIEEGEVKCTQTKTLGRAIELLTLKEGDYFGEMALMLNETRHANCIAIGSTVKCLSLDRDRFGILLGPVQNLLIARMRTRILQSVPLLSKLSDAKLTKLSAVMRVQTFGDGQFIVRQGEEGSRFYIINDGEVRCLRSSSNSSKPSEEVARLYPQDFFGEVALMKNEPHQVSAVACGVVECLVLERSSFQALLSEVQENLIEEAQRRDRLSMKIAVAETTDFMYEDLRQVCTVGTGTFGRVKLVVHTPTNQVYAMKIMSKTEVVKSKQEKNVLAEKELLFECSNCAFILSLKQTFNFPHQLIMLMEFVQGGELWTHIYDKVDTVPRSNGGGFDMYSVRFYAANVILAFKHMHIRNIGYRDLKPENLLLDHRGYLKVIDFGFAKRFPYLKNGQKYDKTYTLCGTPEYLAPEIVTSKGYEKSVDYWALGCLIYELFLARTPFQADYTTKIFQNICSSERSLVFSTKMETSHVNIIKKLLVVNPVLRLGNLSGGVDDIINDPFFDSLDWNSIINRGARAPYIPTIDGQLDTSNFDEYEENDRIVPYTGTQDHFIGF